jgi:hypothetical protein
MISVNVDTGKYVKAILLNREKVLGKQIYAAERHYSPVEIVRVLKEAGGLDVVVEQIDDAEYRRQMAAKGAPDFFIDDMSDNMKFMQTYGFFSEKQSGEGREVSEFLIFLNVNLADLHNSWWVNAWRPLRNGSPRPQKLLF